jgi:hypothetical protein
VPNEPVQCPNCGSGDVRHRAPDSHVCEHCHTTFRWVDPTKITVALKPSVCQCGRSAVAYCCRCGQGLCGGQPMCGNEVSRACGFCLDSAVERDRLDGTIQHLRRVFRPDVEDIVQRTIANYGMPARWGALCNACASGCRAAFEAIENSVCQAVEPQKAFGDFVPTQGGTPVQREKTSQAFSWLGKLRRWIRLHK